MINLFFGMRLSNQAINKLHLTVMDYKKENQSSSNQISWVNSFDLHTTLIHFKQISAEEADKVRDLMSKIKTQEEFSAVIVDVKLLGDSIALVYEHDAPKEMHEELVKFHDQELGATKISRHPQFIPHVSLGSVLHPESDSYEPLLNSLRKKFVGNTLEFDHLDLMTRRTEPIYGPAYMSVLTKQLEKESNQNKPQI